MCLDAHMYIFLLGIFTGVGLLEHKAFTCSTLGDIAKEFSKAVIFTTLPLAMCES